MKKEDLINLKRQISELSDEEKKQRDLYLRDLASGVLQGPPVGYSSIDKQWLKYYPRKSLLVDIPKKTAFQFVYDKYKDSNLTAFQYFKRNITYKEFFNNVEKVAKSLKSKGVKPGDIVTMALPTTPEMVYIFYAINRIGAVTNAIDPRLKKDDISKILVETNSNCLFMVDLFIDEVKDLEIDNIIEVSPLESLPIPIKMISSIKNKKTHNDGIISWKKFLNDGNNYDKSIDFPFKENYPVTIVHTGGTTGFPKGVVLVNENFNAMALTQEISEYNLKEKDTFLTFLPPFIAYCLVNAIHDPLYLGFKNVLIPSFTPEDFPKLMKKYKPNHVLSGPILWDLFIKDKDIDKMDLSYLKSAISGGDVLNVELEREINEFFKQHNSSHYLSQGYGMTEVSAAAVYSFDDCYKEGSVGIPYIKNVISVFSPETLDELQVGETGEICISSPTIMKEYYGNLKATNDIIKIHPDGKKYLHTGDLGTIDKDGNVYIIGRMKRMIVRSGNKLFPSNIETLILGDERIENCVVVAMPNELERHVPVAFVKIKESEKGNEESISNNICSNVLNTMPDVNVPYKVFFVDEFPLTKINKIDYKELENEAKKYVDDERNIIILSNELKKVLK